MPDRAAVNFAAARKALQKAADQHPEWFDRARDALRRSDEGKVQLLHAMMDGLREAYEAGRAGKPPPPLKYVKSIATMKEEAQPAPQRVMRSKPAEPVAPARPRMMRRAAPVEQDEYLQGIMNRGNS